MSAFSPKALLHEYSIAYQTYRLAFVFHFGEKALYYGYCHDVECIITVVHFTTMANETISLDLLNIVQQNYVEILQW